MRQNESAKCEPAARLLSVREVAQLFGVSTRQVWKLQSTGRIPQCVRLAGSVRWNSSDIDSFIQGGCKLEEVS